MKKKWRVESLEKETPVSACSPVQRINDHVIINIIDISFAKGKWNTNLLTLANGDLEVTL